MSDATRKILCLSIQMSIPGLRQSVESQGFELVNAYGMRNAHSVCQISDGCDRELQPGDYVVAIVDDRLMNGLGVNDTIRALSARGIPCIALTTSGHDERGSAEAGAVKVIFSRAVV